LLDFHILSDRDQQTDKLNNTIDPLTCAVEQHRDRRPELAIAEIRISSIKINKGQVED
jgi:hypothetical protein